MATLQAALDALSHDATSWDAAAEVTSDAMTAASQQTLTVSDLSWAAGVVGLSDTYDSMVQKMVGLLSGGTIEMREIATELRAVKTTYEGTDDAARARLDGVWDVA
jgi:uncharacterized protein YukE